MKAKICLDKILLNPLSEARLDQRFFVVFRLRESKNEEQSFLVVLSGLRQSDVDSVKTHVLHMDCTARRRMQGLNKE